MQPIPPIEDSMFKLRYKQARIRQKISQDRNICKTQSRT